MTDKETDKRSGFEILDEFVDANIDELDRLAERNTKDPSTIDDWKGEEHAQRMDEKEKDENKAHIEYLVKTRDALKRIIIKLKAENARLREALEVAEPHIGWGDCTLENVHKMIKKTLQQTSADAQEKK